MDAQTQSTDTYLKFVQWLHDRRKPLMVGGIVVAVVGLVWAFWAWTNATHEADANARFFAIPLETGPSGVAVSPSALLEVAGEYPGTADGEHAQALAAEDLFLQGKYPEAYKEFSEFIARYPDSALIPQASVGAAACLEAEGKTSEAIEKYHDIVLTYPTETSIVSPAKLTLARLYEATGQLQDALRDYVDLARVLNQNPNDPWAAEARERAQLLASKHPDLMKALTGGAPGAAASAPPARFSLSSMGTAEEKHGAAPAGAPKNAPKTSPPSGNQTPNLLTIPGASSNSTGKP